MYIFMCVCVCVLFWCNIIIQRPGLNILTSRSSAVRIHSSCDLHDAYLRQIRTCNRNSLSIAHQQMH